MKILDRYILKKLGLYLLIITPTFVFISLLIKVIEKLKNIKTFNLTDFFFYLLYTVPENLYYILPIATILSVILVYRDLIQTKKIYAVLTSGISIKRLSITFFLFGLLVSLLNLANLEFLMSPANKKAVEFYERLKKHSTSDEPLFVDHTWLKVDEGRFTYFGFLDLRKLRGKDLIFIQFDQKSFKPVFRLESDGFSIKGDNKFLLENVKIVSIRNFPEFDVKHLKKSVYVIDLDLDKLKKLVILKKPISLTELFKKAIVAERFGYPSAYFWSRFFSKLTTVFSPFVLVVLILPLLWINKKGKFVLIFVVIFAYWYLVSVLKALASSGSIPVFSPLIVDILFLIVGLLLLKRVKFIEL